MLFLGTSPISFTCHIRKKQYELVSATMSASVEFFFCCEAGIGIALQLALIAGSSTCVWVTGTDDDLPPSYPNNRGIRGSGRVSGNGRGIVPVSGNGRAIAPPSSYPRAQTDMETQIQQLEQEAYCAVLRAFKAQSDALTWVGNAKLVPVHSGVCAIIYILFLKADLRSTLSLCRRRRV